MIHATIAIYQGCVLLMLLVAHVMTSTFAMELTNVMKMVSVYTWEILVPFARSVTNRNMAPVSRHRREQLATIRCFAMVMIHATVLDNVPFILETLAEHVTDATSPSYNVFPQRDLNIVTMALFAMETIFVMD